MTFTEPNGGSLGPQGRAPGEGPNVLRQYWAVLRRRWKWIALGIIVGLAAGYASTLLTKETRDPTTYYKATNTLIVSGDGSGSGGSVPNLQQAAFLVRSADVSAGIADQVGVSVATVNNQVSALARSDVLAIDVTGISTDPAQAVALADTGASVLNQYISGDTEAQFQATIDEAAAKMDDLQAEVADLDRQIREEPPDVDVLQARRDSTYNQFRLALEAFSALNEQQPSTGALQTLSTASAIQINGKAYNRRLQENINAPGAVSGTTNGTVPTDETNLGTSTPVSKATRIAIGAAAGLVLGLITAFLVEAWDNRLRRRDRAERVTGLPVIAEVPVLPKKQRSNVFVPAVDAPQSRAAERYRSVRTSLLFAMQDHSTTTALPATSASGVPRSRTPVVMVTSPNPGEGKTTTTANLAAVFGDSGMRTLVIDCDYRKPSVGRYLSPIPSLAGDPDETRLDNVWFLPAPRNQNNWGEILTRLRGNVDRWRDKFDIVLLDTPPMLATNDASDLLGVADSVVLVLRAGQTRTGPAEAVANLLGRFRADVLGIVLNGCASAEMDYGYGYGYGYYGGADSYFSDRKAPTASPNGNGTNGNGLNGQTNGASAPAVVGPTASIGTNGTPAAPTNGVTTPQVPAKPPATTAPPPSPRPASSSPTTPPAAPQDAPPAGPR